MAIPFRLEQEIYLKDLNENFISIRGLFLKLTQDRFISSKHELGLFLLNRFERLTDWQQLNCAFWHKKPPFIDYKLAPVSLDELKIEFKYLAKNGKYNRKLACEKIMLRREYFKTDLEKEEIIESLRARIVEIESQLQKQREVDTKPILKNAKTTRISQPQRDIFSLLVLKNYQGMESRNALFDVINADLKEQGINNKGASYQTFDNLIDENIRLTKIGLDGKQILYSPFPSKITK